MIKYRYQLSVKASSRNAVLSGLPDAGVAARAAEIMDYMESGAEKNPADLKTKIKGAYEIIKNTKGS